MTPLAEILDRLRRRRQPPGRAATSVGVPSAESNPGAELAPLFGQLDEIDAEAAAIIAVARSAAERIDHGGQRQVQRILDEAAREAQFEADRLRRDVREATERKAQAILSDASVEAARLRERATVRATAVVDAALELLGSEAG
jgi:vacuolar-type H+-ATPase subunit H